MKDNQQISGTEPIGKLLIKYSVPAIIGMIVNGLYKGGIAEKAGIEIGDIIIAINNRPVKEITWEEQRKGLNLNGEVKYTVKKADGKIVCYTLHVDKQIIWFNAWLNIKVFISGREILVFIGMKLR